MKKTIALLLVLVMALALCACGSKTVVGTWEARQNVAEILGSAEGNPLAKYMGDVDILVQLEMKDDNSFTMTLDGTAMADAMRGALRAYLTDVCAENGTTLDALAEASNTTVDQLIDAMLQAQTPEDLTRTITGTYTVDGSKVSMSYDEGGTREATWEKNKLSVPTSGDGSMTFTRSK